MIEYPSCSGILEGTFLASAAILLARRLDYLPRQVGETDEATERVVPSGTPAMTRAGLAEPGGTPAVTPAGLATPGGVCISGKVFDRIYPGKTVSGRSQAV